MTEIIGITGGIGTGKSVVSRILRCNGFPVYDCDYEAKRLMINNRVIRDGLIAQFGVEIYNKPNELNRKLLASIIFKDQESRFFVNNLVHTEVYEDIKEKTARGTGKFFIESAIMASSRIAGMCDYIWIVTSSLEERIKRVEKRDSRIREEIENIINSQEKELNLLKNYPTITLENSMEHPLLPVVLGLINKNKNIQSYNLSC